MKLVLNPNGGYVEGKYPDTATEGDWYPDDTRILQETPDGRPRPHGPLRIAKLQADDWPSRAGRVWSDQANAWILSGVGPVESEYEAALRYIAENPVPDVLTNPEAVAYARAFRTIVLQDSGYVPRPGSVQIGDPIIE